MKLNDLFASLPTAPSSGITEPPFPYTSVAQYMARHAASQPHATAVTDAEGAFTYAQLHGYAVAVEHFLRARLAPETPVAVLTGRTRWHLAATLGIWRASCVYVPLDPGLPRLRLKHMLDDCAAPVCIADAAHAGLAERLSFACPALNILLCPDIPRFEDAVERRGALMALDLWDHVTREAPDASWRSLFTGLPLEARHLEGMAHHVAARMVTDLPLGARLLDVGGGSGATARALMTHCAAAGGTYTAVELSHHELARVEGLGTELGMKPGENVRTHAMEAADIHLLEPGYDRIVCNSVVENFPGYNYLRHVLDSAVALLREGGRVHVGMVWDGDKRKALYESLRAHAAATGRSAGLTRLEEDQELFVPRAVFADWAALRGDVSVEFSDPACGLAELDAYRYDVTIRRTTAQAGACRLSGTPAQRRLFGGHDLLPLKQEAAASGAASFPESSLTFPESSLPPQAAAYIIYTSGSTGRPKGVLMEHGPLMNLVENLWHHPCAPLGSSPQESAPAVQAPRMAMLASFSFDASLQCWATLCAGGTLFPVDEETRRDPPALHALLCRHNITLCDGTPSLFSLLLDHWEQHEQRPTVRTWLLGGEALRLDMLARLYALPGQEQTRVINAYGPTECCVDVLLHDFDARTWQKHATPPVGVPLRGVRAEVRDAQGRPVPDGIPGELWIGGASLARGYLHAPEQTQTSEAQSPGVPEAGVPEAGAQAFVREGDERWYRTGDVAVRRDALYFCMGREDGQVKTGGYRVETGEVEAALLACPLVRQAAVIAGDFSGNDVITLAAYVVFTEEAQANLAEGTGPLREYLANHLPAHALPAFIVPMTALPMSASGKLDKKNLPAPAASARPAQTTQGRPPHGPVECALADLWGNLLGRPVAEAEADFFALGGHSVLGIRLLSLMEQRFGRRLSLSALFTHATIAAQARLLQAPETEEGGVRILPLGPGHASPESPGKQEGIPLFLFHPAGGSAHCYTALAEHLGQEFAVYAVEPPALHSRWPSMLSVEEMAEGYARGIRRTLEALPREAKQQGNTLSPPYLLGGWSFGGMLAFATARLLRGVGLPERGMIIIDTAMSSRNASSLARMDEAGFLLSLLGPMLPVDEEVFRAMTAEERLNFILREGHAAGRLPGGFDEEHMQALLRTFQYNTLAAARYVPPPMEGRALLLRARQADGFISLEDDPHLNWDNALHGGVELHWVPGSHESILQPHNAPQVAELIRAYKRSLP